MLNWIKCNIDGFAFGTPPINACGGILRNNESHCLVCFVHNLSEGSSLFVEQTGTMLSIEIARDKGWNNLWLEIDLTLVLLAFQFGSMVPWNIRN
jgi:hypothetical protein